MTESDADAPRLSAIVCTYQRYDLLPEVIASLERQQQDAGPLEIIIVDNSPDQHAAAQFGNRFADRPNLRYILESTPGLSNARNVGVAAARADIVAFIDDDAIAAPDWALQFIKAFELFAGKAGAIGGRVVPRWISERPPWLADSLLSYLSILDWGDTLRPLRSNEWLVGCNIAFDKHILSSVGGFSRALGRVGSGLLLSNEETEVLEKIKHSGRSAIYCPDALVEHVIDPERLTRSWFRKRAAWQAVSEYIKDTKSTAAYSPAAAEHLRIEWLGSSPAIGAGFFEATDNPQQFKRDVGLIYDLVVSALSGGAELNVKGTLEAPPSLQSRIVARARAAAQRSDTFRKALHRGLQWSRLRQ